MPNDLTYSVEPWAHVRKALESLFPAHHAEMAEDGDMLPACVDHEAYEALDAAGQLVLVTAYSSAELVGYCVAFVREHIHSAHVLCGFFDLYYLVPAQRRGWNAARLFQRVEEELQARGVQKSYISTKLSKDIGPLLRWLRWRHTDDVYTKVLQEEKHEYIFSHTWRYL